MSLTLSGTTPLGFKNILMNGDFRINQRGASSPIATANAYNYDRWYYDGTNLVQMVEDGNYKPNTVYTLSGQNVTTQQLTSPASGHWKITVPSNANMVQLEEGSVSTPFELRPISLELSLCKRYYESLNDTVIHIPNYGVTDGQLNNVIVTYPYKIQKRVIPSIVASSAYMSGLNIIAYKDSSVFFGTATNTGITARVYNISIDAEIPVV